MSPDRTKYELVRSFLEVRPLQRVPPDVGAICFRRSRHIPCDPSEASTRNKPRRTGSPARGIPKGGRKAIADPRSARRGNPRSGRNAETGGPIQRRQPGSGSSSPDVRRPDQLILGPAFLICLRGDDPPIPPALAPLALWLRWAVLWRGAVLPVLSLGRDDICLRGDDPLSPPRSELSTAPPKGAKLSTIGKSIDTTGPRQAIPKM
jgi:hypothetical protein